MLNFPFNKQLSPMQAADMKRSVSREEIRLVFWNCGENKSPGPDGYTFEFFRKYWNIVGPDLCEAVEYFFETCLFPKGCNSSFVALIPKVADAKSVNDFRPISLIGSVYKVITKFLANRLALVIADLVSDTQSVFVANRQILDGPFILNEILHWCKRKKKQAMFFKVDFTKAYDSVHWDYLLDVLEAFGFGQTWCNWIRGTFSSTRALVLVNGSPSNEFSFHCGLKQGDPLSPFLFILIMESLHLSFSRAVDEGLFKGVQLQGSISISYLFYADDAMLGVGIPRNIVMQAASSLAWDDTMLKLRSRLSNWKVKTLSIGGRLTLLKSVLGASPLYNMSIFKVPKGILKTMEAIRSNFFNGFDSSIKKITWAAWDKILASKKNGGLDGSLWFRVIQALYGPSIVSHPVNFSSNWCSIVRELHLLSGKGFDFLSYCKKRIGDGNDARFWYDIWIGDKSLQELFPRLFALELDKEISVAEKMKAVLDHSFRRHVRDGYEHQQLVNLYSLMESVSLSQSHDRWFCDLTGLYRYRLGDVVEVTGFYKKTPKLNFLSRRKLILTVNIDKNTEKDLQLAVQKGSQPLLKDHAELVDFTSHANITNRPGHYVVYWEIKGEVSEHILDQCCKEIDAAFVDHGYVVSRRTNTIGPLELCIVERGTFKKIMEHFIGNGATMSQFKTPRCTSNHFLLKILNLSTIKSIRSSAYE
ncbi:RNA-directed DNA polymerase, eukaryota [Tanacetum coccineum]